MSFSTADLLAAVSRRTFMPTGQSTLTEEEQLALADEVMQTAIVPDIVAVREEYFVNYVDYAITAARNAYDIPPRSVGLIVREIWLVDGTSVNPDFTRKEPEEIASDSPGTPDGFYLRSNSIIVHPTPISTAKSIRVHFPLAPGDFVLESAAAVITSIDTETQTITVGSIPNAWATGDLFDLIRQDGGQEPLAIDLESSLVTGPSITLPTLPAGLRLRVGDYVSLAGQTPLVQLPPTYRPVLAQGVAAEVLAATNQPGADAAKKKFEEMRKTAQRLITPRVQGEDRSMKASHWFSR